MHIHVPTRTGHVHVNKKSAK